MTLTPDEQLARLTSRQANLFTLQQAVACGLHRNTVLGRLETGRYLEDGDGVLRLGGAAVAAWEDVHHVVLAVGGDDVIVARHTAAALHALSPAPRSKLVHLLVHNRSFIEAPRGARVHRSEHVVERWDIALVDGIRCTSVPRTLCDLAREVPPGLFTALVNDAIRKGLTDVVDLQRMTTRLGRFRHKRRLLQICDHLGPHAGDANNATETMFLDLCEQYGLPLIGINVPMRDANGRQRYVDALLRRNDGRLVPVEVDGHQTHWTRLDRWHDEEREDLLGEANPRLLPFVRVPADEVWHAPDRVVTTLREACRAPLPTSTVPV